MTKTQYLPMRVDELNDSHVGLVHRVAGRHGMLKSVEKQMDVTVLKLGSRYLRVSNDALIGVQVKHDV